jgi:hypothetical protein
MNWERFKIVSKGKKDREEEDPGMGLWSWYHFGRRDAGGWGGC